MAHEGGTGEAAPEVEPLDVDGVRTVAVGTVLWAVAFVVVLIFRDSLPPDGEWWLWTCLAGAGLGLLGLEYTRKRRAAGPDLDDDQGGPSDAPDNSDPGTAPAPVPTTTVEPASAPTTPVAQPAPVVEPASGPSAPLPRREPGASAITGSLVPPETPLTSTTRAATPARRPRPELARASGPGTGAAPAAETEAVPAAETSPAPVVETGTAPDAETGPAPDVQTDPVPDAEPMIAPTVSPATTTRQTGSTPSTPSASSASSDPEDDEDELLIGIPRRRRRTSTPESSGDSPTT